MAIRHLVSAGGAVALFCSTLATGAVPVEVPDARGVFSGAYRAVRFDVSPPLRSMTPIPPDDLFADSVFFDMMIDPDPPGKLTYGEQDVDQAVQEWNGAPLLIPAPTHNFIVGTGTANPPDPVGDVGPNHYVRMSNASFQIFNKTGVSQFGPAQINTLFAGFGGACEVENAGDPIVLYDQLADRWLLTQFSDGTAPFFLCVALSTSSDPTGTYFRWAFPTAGFPDYPKFGVWPNAYLFSTRETTTSSIGAYAVDRAQMLAGVPNPVVISFVNSLNSEFTEFLGDGLLPADVDGSTPPPAGSPAYFLGTMDDGGPYGAEFDAIFVWEFDINFANPPASSFVLSSILPIAPYDTIYPCNGRSCVPQPPPLGAVDILSYRQRPMHRAAYRNYGGYESIVTNQSVEAAANMAGIRWWEIRSPGNNPVLYQDSTYAPGVTDQVQRWMGSIAADKAGNLGLGYSASSTTVFPSIRYSGRLESDALGTMAQGEGVIIDAAGGSTQTTRRWGDYTSINIDPTDDCTFWYINEYFAVSGTQWTLRAGSFKFPECGQPNYSLTVLPLTQDVCAGDPASYSVYLQPFDGFVDPAAMSSSGEPAGTTATFLPPLLPMSMTGSYTISNTGALAFGTYGANVTATAGAGPTVRQRSVSFDLYTAAPAGPTLTSPADGAIDLKINPLLTWNAPAEAQTYVAEVATDAAFTNIVFTSAVLTATQVRVPPILSTNTTYYWRVRATNACGTGVNSAAFSFTTRPAPGQCALPPPVQPLVNYADNMENGANGWTVDPPTGTTWSQSTASPSSGLRSWLAVDVVTASDQRLISPAIALPAGQTYMTLRFDHEVNMEPNGGGACFDGGFVEISTDNGTTWTPIPATDVLEDFQDGPLDGGQQAWCGTQAYTRTSLDIASYAGQTVRFRFRAITDGSVGFAPEGWYVDDVQVIGCGTSDTMLNDGFEDPL
jgi:hypothetical protein